MKPDNISNKDWELALKRNNNDVTYLVSKLSIDYPIQYLIGDVDFYGHIIKVNENVLIPRFETEGLVEKTIKLINPKKRLNILEIGTGSGCISVALKSRINCDITATDVSKAALEVALENFNMNNANISLKHHDILNEEIEGIYDLIISNPPYVSRNEMVDPQIIYEPQNAIFADNEGLIFYDTIIKKSLDHISYNGIIAFEIGSNQAEQIKNIALKIYPNSEVVIEKDLCGRDRYLFILNKN